MSYHADRDKPGISGRDIFGAAEEQDHVSTNDVTYAEHQAAEMAAVRAESRARQPLVRRLYTQPGETAKDVLDAVTWEKRTATIREADGKIVFQADGEVPAAMTQLASDIAISKYFRRAGLHGDPKQGETSFRQVVERIVYKIRDWGGNHGYFRQDSTWEEGVDSPWLEDMRAFEAELAYLLVHQIAAFNSPVWFNVGLDRYDIVGSGGQWAWAEDGPHAYETPDAYTRPQASACFISTIEDDLMGIFDSLKTEARLFKYGSGVGANFSRLRSNVEKLSGGGTSSGLMSFLGVFDKGAGSLKSGGGTRRAAKMVCLDADHPEIEAFVTWKAEEERKAKILIEFGGYPADFNGPAYGTVSGQNSNNSVRLTDAFMRKVTGDDPDDSWELTARTTGAVVKTISAKGLFRLMAESAWACADPGVQYDTTINTWHTCKETGPIRASNPCQPGWAPVLTRAGISQLSDVMEGDEIWSGSRWTKVVRKWSTGVKPVYRYRTTAGIFVGTEEHRVVSYGDKIEVGQAEAIDTCQGRLLETELGPFDAQAIVDGLVCGDGGVRYANERQSAYTILYVGELDREAYFADHDISSFVDPKVFDGYAHRVKSSLLPSELPNLPDRTIPDKYYRGDRLHVRSFLRGLYSANGSIVGGVRVTLKAVSFPLIERVQQMLSMLGIRSYYTTNKAKPVTFANGTYLCRESYDLSITADRGKFEEAIGFIHPDKQRRLRAACERPVNEKRTKKTYEILSTELLGEEQVFDIEVDDPDHTYWSGGLLVSNCSEYMFLDDTACNLASLNLVKFLGEEIPEEARYGGSRAAVLSTKAGSFDVERYRHAARTMFVAQEILVGLASYPTKAICENSHDFRPLGLGYANLGALLMRLGEPYDSREGRLRAGALTAILTGEAACASADMAERLGPFAGYEKNRDSMLDVMRMHEHEAGPNGTLSLEALATPTEFAQDHADFHDAHRDIAALVMDARTIWRRAVALGESYGYRNAQYSVCAPTGCLVAGSLVVTSQGLCRIEDLGDVDGAQWQPLDVMVQTDEGPRPATNFFVNGVADIWQTTTRRGYVLRGTDKHQLKVVDEEGAWGWKRLDALEKGDVVPLRLGGLCGSPREVKLPPCPPSYRTNHRRGVKTPDRMTADLAEYVGMFAGNGSVHQKGLRLAMAAEDKDAIARAADLARDLFGVEPLLEDHQGYVSVNLHSTQARLWWTLSGFAKAPGDKEGKGYTTSVPDAILASNDPLVYGRYLRGLFTTDGSVCSGVPSFTNKSLPFVRDVHVMLLALGCPFHADEQIGGISGKPVHRLTGTSRFFNERFVEAVGFGASRKQEKLLTSDRPQADRIPVPAELLERLCGRHHPLRPAVDRHMKKFGRLARHIAVELQEASGSAELKHLLEFFYDTIVDLAVDGREPTYDISVPSNVTYVAGGFVSHNTIGLLMDCDTTGVEPDFALVKHKKLAGGGMMKIVNQSVPAALSRLGYAKPAVELIEVHILEHGTIEGAPVLFPEHLPIFDCATPGGSGSRFIRPEAHLEMLAVTQPFYSGSLSKTVNLPPEATAEEIEALYLKGWKLGLKCVALYRDGCKASQPLSGAAKKKPAIDDAAIARATAAERALGFAPGSDEAVLEKLSREVAFEFDKTVARDIDLSDIPDMAGAKVIARGGLPRRTGHPGGLRHKLPPRRKGFTQKARVAGHKIFLRTGEYEDGSLGEIFIDMHKEGAAFRSLMNVFAQAVSIGLQHGVPLETFVKQFTFTRFEPSGVVEGHETIKMATSIVDYIFKVLAVDYLGMTELAQIQVEPGPTADPTETGGERARRGREAAADAVRARGDARPAVQAWVGEDTDPTLAALHAALDRASREVAKRHDPPPMTVAQEHAAQLRETLEQARPQKPGVDAEMAAWLKRAERPFGRQESIRAATMGDAPPCHACGHLMTRSGTCYRCTNCGETSGCS